MPIQTENKWRAEVRDILKDCISITSSDMGAVILKKGNNLLLPPIALGFPRGENINRLLGLENPRKALSVLSSKTRKSKPGSSAESLAIAIKEGRKLIGFMVLLKKKGRVFSPRDYKMSLAAAREAGRYIELSSVIKRLQKNYTNTILVLLKTMEAKDYFSRGHSTRVAEYCLKAGPVLGLTKSEMDTLYWAALLHDIGKVGIVDAILQKKDRLNKEEKAIIREHSVIGQKIVQDLDTLRDSSRIIRSHHERYDGKGYPDGLSGRDIPLLARILAMAETFDTITSHTPYRIGQPVEIAASELRKEKGRQFDPDLVDPFLESILF